MFVGEAPGKDEEAQGRPFVGRAGNVVNQFFADRLGLTRDRFFCANLCNNRPFKNDFKNVLGSDELQAGLERLRADIERVNPRVIVAAGAWPLFFLTGKTNDKGVAGTGIMNWRGSVLPNALVKGGPKVVASLHPAFLLRNWKWHPIAYDDWFKAQRHVSIEGLGYPEYELLVDPPNISELVQEAIESEWMSCDIENFTDRSISCVGFAYDVKKAIVITSLKEGWQENVQAMLDTPAGKIFQFGAYDINFMFRFYGWKTRNYRFDTYVAAASLTPEFPRGLDFLTSIYTPFPYYKVERKEWKTSQDLGLLWEYNGKDDIAELMIGLEQMIELRERFGWTSNTPMTVPSRFE
jgi:uracil-DNA glycosylase family 4